MEKNMNGIAITGFNNSISRKKSEFGILTYADYAKAMLMSMAINSSEQEIHVYLLGFEDMNLEKINSKAKIIPWHSVKNGAAASHIRGELLNLEISKNSKPLMWCDPDIIVRSNLDKIWEDIKPTTLKVLYRPHQKEYRKFQDGVYVLGYSDATKKLVHRLYNKLKKHHYWYADQHQLYLSYLKYKKEINLVPLQIKFNNNKFLQDDVVWHPYKKQLSSIFENEFNKYLKMAKEKIGETV
jgi:hypothetical protein